MKNRSIMPSVTIVSSDTALLRETSWTLSCFGYCVTTSVDWSDPALWRLHTDNRIFLFDGRDAEATRRVLAEPRGLNGEVRIVMLASSECDEASRSLVAAADDAISLPIAAFELLARMRCAVRRLEYERRVEDSACYPRVAGLLSQQGFLRAAGRSLGASSTEPSCLLVLGIDFRDQSVELFGRLLLEEFESTIADVLRIQLDDQPCGQSAGGQFCVLLNGCDEEEARAIGQRVLESLARQSLRPGLRRTQLTLTALAQQLDAQVDLEDQLGNALALHQHGSALGGNVVLLASELQRSLDSWQQNMEAGTPFESAVACDVMEAFPAVIEQSDVATLSDLITARADAGSHEAIPPCIPVLNDHGLLLGVLSTSASHESRASYESIEKSSEVGPPGLASVVSIPHDLPLSELLDAFSRHESDLLIVCEQDAPIGYVTRESMGKLFADTIDAGRYQLGESRQSAQERFVVPLDGYATAP